MFQNLSAVFKSLFALLSRSQTPSQAEETVRAVLLFCFLCYILQAVTAYPPHVGLVWWDLHQRPGFDECQLVAGDAMHGVLRPACMVSNCG